MTKQELITKALEILNSNDDALMDAISELGSWNGFAEDYRCIDMYELDDFFYGIKPRELLELVSDDFNACDDYFYQDCYGLHSTDYPADLYRDNLDMGEVLDNLVEGFAHISLYNDELSNIVDALYNEEFDEGESEGGDWTDEE